MNSLRLLFIFALVLTTTIGLQYEDIIMSLDNFSEEYDFFNETKNCTKPGYMCEDCSKRAFCYKLPNGDFIQTTVPCKLEETCLEKEDDAICTTESNPSCQFDDYYFVCYQTGYFPNPFDCSKYHLCTTKDEEVNKVPVDLSCPDGFHYDPLTTLCRIKATKCNDLTKPCTTIGQTGSITANPFLYYGCLPVGNDNKLLFPQVFYCTENFIFDGKDCINSTVEAKIVEDNCIATGNFYTPKCTQYNRCTAGQKPTKVDCAIGQKFDPRQSLCTPFTCL